MRDISLVLREMANSKAYDFSSNPELVGLLERRANAMQGQWKETTMENVDVIRREKAATRSRNRENKRESGVFGVDRSEKKEA